MLLPLVLLLVLLGFAYICDHNWMRAPRVRQKVIRALFPGENEPRLLCNGYTSPCESLGPCCLTGLKLLYEYAQSHLSQTLRPVCIKERTLWVMASEPISWTPESGYRFNNYSNGFGISYEGQGSNGLELRICYKKEDLPSNDDPNPHLLDQGLQCLRKYNPSTPGLLDKCFIINDRKRWDRLHAILTQLQDLGLPGEPVEAVMGRALNIPDLISSGILAPSVNMMKGAIGCYLSHIEAWRRIAECPDGLYAVLEDDAWFLPEFRSCLSRNISTLRNRTIPWDICMLGATPHRKSQIAHITGDIYELGNFVGAWSYLLTPQTAKRLLQDVFPIRYPVDLVISIFDPVKFPSVSHVGYDDRFFGILKTVIINERLDRERLGIVTETSTAQKDSMSETNNM